MDSVQDVFCVGEAAKEMSRWRPFVDVLPDSRIDPNWCPHLHNEKLLVAHQHQGQIVYEHALILDSLEGSRDRKWLTKPILSYFKLIAEIELRCIEVEICSFQLTTETVGIDCSVSKNALYAAATFAHSVHLYLFDLACKMSGQKSGRGDIMAGAPSRTDGARQLASKLDKEVFAVHLLTSQALPRMKGGLTEPDAAGLAARMGLMMRALDKVIVVV